MSSTVGRYAPSPSGRMHLGNLCCCLLAWLSAKSSGGKVVLRIEDLDAVRCPREFADLLEADLAWLGLAADEGGRKGGPRGPYYQSERSAIYEEYYQKLVRKGLVYPCFCSRSQLHAADAPHRSDGNVVYAGTCRNLTPEEIVLRTARRKPAWRVMVPDETISFVDGHMGPYAENLAQDCGDFYLRRADGVFAYQLAVVDAMLAQEKIDQATYDAAKAEEVVFTNGYTNLGNYVGPQEEDEKPAVVSTANNSYFTDEVITDVAEKFVEVFGLTDDPANADGYVRTAFEKAVSKVYNGGYKIYTTQNPKIQDIAESVFENTNYANYTDSKGEPLQAAITIVDPYTGDVVAMVGGTGAKEVDRGWNWATSARQPGSATKPVSVYAPALDNGTITAASAIDDYPVRDLPGYGAWPSNSGSGFRGLTSFYTALVRSLNTCAVRTVEKLGTYQSYTFMVEKLGFTTLTQADSQQSGNMGLGGYEYGVTTEEMAAAYGAFVNDGVYTPPRTFYRVEDSQGNLVCENNKESNVAMKATTAYIIRQTLKSVITSGTGGEARFSGMTIAGKTGTTDENRDRYFAGFSPYYSAAVWTGYKSNERFSESLGNPSAVLWREVMRRIHDGLENKDFNSCSGLVQVTVCQDSGLLATDACTHDLRGNRVTTVTVAADTAPTQSCNVHKMVRYCKDGKHLATEYCPASSVVEIAALDWNREIIKDIKAQDDEYLLQTLTGKEEGELCPVHNKKPSIFPIIPGDDDDDGSDTRFGSWSDWWDKLLP